MITNLISTEKVALFGSYIGLQPNENAPLVKTVHPSDLMAELSEEMHGLTRSLVNRRIKQFKKKELIFSDGDDPHYLYFLSKGKVKTFKAHEYGKELITSLYKGGDFLGYNALLEKKTYSESAETLEESEICLVPKEDFFSLINNNIHLLRKFMCILSNDLAEKKEEMVNLAYSSVRKRVAKVLLVLLKKYDNSKDKVTRISLSRNDLANIVGTSTESLIRSLSDFKQERCIEISDGVITIIDIEKLEKI